MFDRVLNMPVNCLSSFAMVLSGIHGKVDICQTDNSIHSKRKISPYAEVIWGNTTFELTNG